MTFECTVRCSLPSFYKAMKRASHSSFRFIVQKVANERPISCLPVIGAISTVFVQNGSVHPEGSTHLISTLVFGRRFELFYSRFKTFLILCGSVGGTGFVCLRSC